MKKQDFYFDLPKKLIAQYPLANRSDSRLLSYNRRTQSLHHYQFKHLPSLLDRGDLLVFNDSRVMLARLYGEKKTGGKVEILIERLLEKNCFLAHIKSSKPLAAGMTIFLDKGWKIEVIEKQEDIYYCKTFDQIDQIMEDIGHLPLPPYITRKEEKEDLQRYQTIYASTKGSVAAPTAGLHFDDQILRQLQEKGIQCAYLTLHVGAGTFKPVRCDDIRNHIMHPERCIISSELSHLVNTTRQKGGRIIAVGTTSMRSLESASCEGELLPYQGEVDIFIYPSYQFQICDGLITNFHLPESTLLMLVSAFLGHAQTMRLYKEAIGQGYRFFSYGDASLLL